MINTTSPSRPWRKMRSSIVSVNPELATRWLDRNVSNRPMSRTTVDQLVQQIERGEWQLTHQGIAFDEDGNLLDGQHRLQAIVRTGAVVKMLVFEGVPKTSFSVLDTGRKRTGKDVLSLAGESNTAHLASALRGLHLYHTMPEVNWSGAKAMVSNEQLLDILTENPGMRDALLRGSVIHRAIRMTITAASIGWYVTSQARPDIDPEPWFEGITTGANLTFGDPRLTLRNTMIALGSGKITRRREDSREHLFYYLKSWNAWSEGREQKILRRSPREKMPQPSSKNTPNSNSRDTSPLFPESE
ncbi:hypothetical protein [Nocardiopsis dassonvillei]|uniref:hypothetical protein n=1 Tax=Nocardiopsis dassonvillei TaxID=2014 RepID=UPI0036720910